MGWRCGGCCSGSAAPTIITENLYDADHALDPADAFAVVAMDSASPVTVTVPAGVFDPGTTIEVYAAGAGLVTIAADTDVQLEAAFGRLTLATQYASATLRFRFNDGADDIWELAGMLS
jgi:hypothetical protein